jgi:glycosyltransferase involved in cell wall biosynthesis
MKNDELDQIVFYFLSQKNATSARYFPLFDTNPEVRIVFMKGFPIKYTDSISLKIFYLLRKLCKQKINNYKIVHIFDLQDRLICDLQVLHIDDPTYTDNEILSIRNWEKRSSILPFQSIIVCTNKFTLNWLKSKECISKVIVIEQGFGVLPKTLSTKKFNKFSCVYSSPYIHYGLDKHSNHSTWGSRHLLDDLIPKITEKVGDIQFHLIGEIGPNALKRIKTLENVFCYGRVDFDVNLEIMSKCTIGIYPRNLDLKRSILKIFSYMGAGLPVVAYDLVDTEIVKSESLGLVVKSQDEFIEAIVRLKTDNFLLKKYEHNVTKIRDRYLWSNLSIKLNDSLSVIQKVT